MNFITNYQSNTESGQPPGLGSKLHRALSRYLGFVIGTFTIPVTFSYLDAYHDWQEPLLIGSQHFPKEWWWANVLLNSILFGSLSFVFIFGLYGLLGGLLGNHPIYMGIIICTVTVALTWIISHLLSTDPPMEMNWFVMVAFPLSIFGSWLGLVLPYLLGFSLRRLAILFVYPLLRSSP